MQAYYSLYIEQHATMNISFKKKQEKVTRISKEFSYYGITIRKCHYSQRGFHTVECGSNSGEGRVSNFIFLVEAGGGGVYCMVFQNFRSSKKHFKFFSRRLCSKLPPTAGFD